ncbi:NYN domain-containing protein [Helicobacter sp. MIT 01-3238]|uniref:NYN domain-containing protein n=1 Tax=Helicobacter sp. MIT 01-3238 TaxID=398627 RepID=UPI000E1EF81B|nr:NYN domain-containing protein [Helicobacter sp. MIT 01-3238]RDU51488.1 hypothetical protein CQA40_10020 [Helicobacter sp. MIT 01-3238]
MKRVNAYIDGYNLYHAEVKLEDNRLKWVNLRALCQHFCDDGDILDKVYYFTSYAKHIKYRKTPEHIIRHKTYIYDFLKDFGVEATFGFFNTFEGKTTEKQTDVNLALQLFEDAINDKYDKAILLSGDTDFIPAIERVNKLGKEILLLLPPKPSEPPKHSCSPKFDKVITNKESIKKDDLASHLLPAKSKNNKMMPKQYLSSIQAKEQPEELTKNLKYSSWIPKEFPRCEKCKDYLDYERYEKVKPKD